MTRPADADPDPAIRLDGVTLRLGGRAVLSGVDLRIPAGRFVGVLGANGAGKTTLMRAILGLVPPAAGRIAVLGHPPGRAVRGRVGYMPQFHRADGASRLSGRAFVAAALHGHRWGLPWHPSADRRALDRREVSRVIELVGAEALASRPLSELSGGERQRLLLAQSLLGSPELLLLDEPLISLDPSRQHEIVSLVRALQRELRLSVLFCAHELNPLLGALDQVLYLGAGHAAIGTVDDVITAPVLSRLYGAPIDVVRLGGRIFVMSGPADVERDAQYHSPCAVPSDARLPA
ncbi:MAG: ATP-binding cassette domain-containing protein [Gluconacetobacter diazotrophicus]|nr:ATP-binding cassette domain-containing protein [Gluconacetobacter diazotrophicus]